MALTLAGAADHTVACDMMLLQLRQMGEFTAKVWMWISLGNRSFIPYNDVMLEMETPGEGLCPSQPVHNLLLLNFRVYFKMSQHYLLLQVQKNQLCFIFGLYFGYSTAYGRCRVFGFKWALYSLGL